jgi:hypothetical protein
VPSVTASRSVSHASQDRNSHIQQLGKVAHYAFDAVLCTLDMFHAPLIASTNTLVQQYPLSSLVFDAPLASRTFRPLLSYLRLDYIPYALHYIPASPAPTTK